MSDTVGFVDLCQAAEKAIQAQQQQQQQQQQVDWRDLEAPLYCIRAVAGPEVLHERTVLPQVREGFTRRHCTVTVQEP